MGDVNVKYNLTEDQSEDFLFSIEDHVYRMKYPSMKDIEGFKNLKTNNDIISMVSKYTKKEKSTSPALSTAVMSLQPLSFLKFIKMIRIEFMGEDASVVDKEIDQAMRAEVAKVEKE